MDRGATNDHYLLFRSRSCVGALALADVNEVMRPQPVERIAGAPAFVLGLAIIRGAPSPVIDAARLLTGGGTEPAQSRQPRFIALKVGSRGACLAVDSVLDVCLLPPDQLQQTPPLMNQSGAALLPLIAALDRDLLVVLNAARLVPESVWTSMQAAEASA